MTIPLHRLLLRGALASALILGPVAIVAPTAGATGCADGAARVFFADETNACLGAGTTSYSSPQAVSKVCSASGVTVNAQANYKKSRKQTTTRKLDLSSGKCGRFAISGQLDATVTVS